MGYQGKVSPRYKCRNPDCQRCTFILNYSYQGHLPEVKQQIIEMALNSSGIRDTARILKISPSTVIKELKKKGLTYRQSMSLDCLSLNPTKPL